MDTSIVLGPLTPIEPMNTSPKTMEEYRQSVCAWHLSKQRDTLAGIWDDPKPTPSRHARTPTPPRSALSEDEEFGLRTSKRAVNPLTGLPFVKSPPSRHARLPSRSEVEQEGEAPSPRARLRDPTGMKSVYRSMAVYDDKPVSPRSAAAAAARPEPPRTPTRTRQARTSLSNTSSNDSIAAPLPGLSASCSSCSSSSVASTGTDSAEASRLSSPVDLNEDGLALNFSNLALADETAVRTEQSKRGAESDDASRPATPYGVYAGGVIDLNTPARTPPTTTRSRSSSVYPIIVHPSSRDGSPTPSRPRNIRQLTQGTDMTEASTSTSGESFVGLMDSPWATPGIMPGTGKKSGNRLSAEIGRMFAKQAASNSAASAAAAAATASATTASSLAASPAEFDWESPPGSGRTVHNRTAPDPPSPACEAPPEFRFNAMEPHVGHFQDTSDSTDSTPSTEGEDGRRTSPSRRVIRQMTFQRPHSKSARAKGRGGNWTGEEGMAI